MSDLEDFPEHDDPTDALPTRIAGRYRLERPIGIGRIATIYRAFDNDDGSEVAIKLLHSSLQHDEKALKRFANEGEVMSSLDHPHVLKVLDAREDPHSGRYFIAMEHVDGISLKAALIKGYHFSEIEAIDICLDLLTALAQLHHVGRVHRDVSPSNILLHPDGRALLADFGIIRLGDDEIGEEDEITDHGDNLGELGYVANEQRGDPHNVTFHADIYSVGALLYAMMSERPPADLSLASMRDQLMHDIPGRLVPIVKTATAWLPSERFEDARDMAEDLLEIRDSIAKEQTLPMRGIGWMAWFDGLTPTGTSRQFLPSFRAPRTSQQPIVQRTAKRAGRAVANEADYQQQRIRVFLERNPVVGLLIIIVLTAALTSLITIALT